MSYPGIRTEIRDAFVHRIRREFPEVSGIAGVATGGIAQAALVADAMDLPMIYIRSKAKGHGMENLLEGKVDPEGRYIVIEDLVSTGGSSAKAVKALQASGATVLATLAIFSYGFPQADTTFLETGTPYFPLATMDDLLEKATDIGYLTQDQVILIQQWRQAPASWGK